MGLRICSQKKVLTRCIAVYKVQIKTTVRNNIYIFLGSGVRAISVIFQEMNIINASELLALESWGIKW